MINIPTYKKDKHWSNVEFLSQSIKNPNIHIKGTHSYYSDAWGGGFEDTVVRYLYGDEFSLQAWEPQWPIDQLFIGDYVCIASETIILLGGNHTHRADWFCLYPFEDHSVESYKSKGDTIIGDGVWLGIRSLIMPGIRIGEGAIVAASSVVTKDVEPYTLVAGNPAKIIKNRFDQNVTEKLLTLKIYDWSEQKMMALRPWLCASDIKALELASDHYDVAHKKI
jgi:chloramphenicol O-acetyltransferase type B